VKVVAAAPATQPAAAARANLAMQLLRDNCIACHNPEKHKGGLILTSRASALKGNGDGPAFVPGKAAESRLIEALSPDADPHMPPKKQLPAEQIAALREWIDGGASWDETFLTQAPAATTRPVVLHALPEAYQPVLAVALAPDDKRLAVGRGGRVFVHDLAAPGRPVMRVLVGPRDAVQSLAWSRDGRRLAAGEYERVLVWDLGSDEPPAVLKGLSGRVTALQFLHDGESLVAAAGGAGQPGRLHLYHLPDAKPRKSVEAHADTVAALTIDRDGALLASAGADKLVKLWELASLKEVGRLEGHTGHVLSLAFKPDGSLLASGGADRDVKVWDVKTRAQKTSIGPHPGPVTALAWPGGGDSKSLIAATDDGTLRTDTESAQDVGRPLPGVDDVLYCLAATSDGKTLLAGCHDGTVYAWSGGKLEGKLKE
jgi:WD40 repeat protein/mono/diheme cytochrome c family protein